MTRIFYSNVLLPSGDQPVAIQDDNNRVKFAILQRGNLNVALNDEAFCNEWLNGAYILIGSYEYQPFNYEMRKVYVGKSDNTGGIIKRVSAHHSGPEIKKFWNQALLIAGKASFHGAESSYLEWMLHNSFLNNPNINIANQKPPGQGGLIGHNKSAMDEHLPRILSVCRMLGVRVSSLPVSEQILPEKKIPLIRSTARGALTPLLAARLLSPGDILVSARAPSSKEYRKIEAIVREDGNIDLPNKKGLSIDKGRLELNVGSGAWIWWGKRNPDNSVTRLDKLREEINAVI